MSAIAIAVPIMESSVDVTKLEVVSSEPTLVVYKMNEEQRTAYVRNTADGLTLKERLYQERVNQFALNTLRRRR